MKKNFVKIFSLLLIFCLAFICTACSGATSDEQEQLVEDLDSGKITEEEFNKKMQESLTHPLYGTKLLYRNDSGTNIDEVYANYYANFSAWISYYLVGAYGYYDSGLASQFGLSTTYPEYFYDSIRYQITDAAEITSVTEKKASTETTNSISYFAIKADTDKAWNWTFNYDYKITTPDGKTKYTSIIDALNGNDFNTDKNGNIYFKINDYSVYFDITAKDFKDNSNSFYRDSLQYNENLRLDYLSTMLTNNQTLGEIPENTNTVLEDLVKDGKQSDVVKAIEYVLYCYALEAEPVDIQVNGLTVSVPGSNIDAELAKIKAEFKKNGSYIGFSEDNRAKLADFVCEKLIGTNAMQESFTYTSGATLVIEYEADGTTVKNYYVQDGTPQQNITVQRQYEETVKNIINTAYEYVTIGNVNGDDLTINNRYLNSQFQDLWGNDFFISHEGDEFAKIPEREYQSAVIMLKEEFSFDNLYIAVRYSGNDNKKEGYNVSQVLEINVHLNLFINGEWKRWGTERLRVPAGEFDWFEGDLPDGDYGQIAKFAGLEEKYRDPQYADWGFTYDDGIKVGAFKPEMDGGILSQGMVRKGKYVGYTGQVRAGNPISLIGSSKVVDYYKIIESSAEEIEETGTFYRTGMFNYEKLTGDNMCDYIEIQYEVLRTPGDYDKNYRFQTGIYLME